MTKTKVSYKTDKKLKLVKDEFLYNQKQGRYKSTTTYEWTKNLSWKDQIQFKWEKQNRNVCGLNEKDFKFFKYDDPYKKIYMAKCPVCEKIALEDQFGNGKCDNCGFEYDKVIDEEEKNYGATYPMLVTRETARKQYKNSQPFKATFNEFVGGLMFYGEMEFEYLGEKYIVFRYTDKFEIEFYNDNDYKNKQIYNSKEAFENYANINGKLLKDIWQNVENAQYMS